MMTIARAAMSSPLIQSLCQSRHHNWNNNPNNSRSRHLNNNRNNNPNRHLNPNRHPEFRSKKTFHPLFKRVVLSNSAMLVPTHRKDSIWRRTQTLRKVMYLSPEIATEVSLSSGLTAVVCRRGDRCLTTKFNSSKIGSMRAQKITKEHQYATTLGRGSNLPTFFIS